ncbi:hypothetical protein [Streptococcus oralis]|uniref:hypothetical protein n=1 Tax=Streptococcus oralis TaxID=1303 RepID=UPI0001E5333A|nr:hypothetical protein [Streptococcus oralis]EFO02540.1 hypothetical protein SMSK23_0648 [Streptococcus oralis ATCC 35037]KZX03655.1 hypothetical protein A4222_03555 [Streptococcus oralis]OOR77175.1 hypothetical protein B0176_09135 [Streptococcus oralis]QQB72688.1 hypothetical protein I6H77_03860 [Streptococcus oralis]VEF78176.1 Uncharacterised protein [Streptococcus oralis ATCC 35037]
MSQERYLQIKKEHQVRKFVGRFLFILLAILDVLLVSSHSNYVPLVTVAMVTIVPFNHYLLGPLRRQKKAIEKEHPEWKILSTKGVKVPSAEANKRTFAGIGILMALLLSFGLFYKPVKQPNDQVNKPPKLDFNTPGTSKSSESSSSSKTKESSSSESKSSSSTEQSSKTESSGTKPSKSESNNPYYQIPGLTDEQVRDIISKSVKDLREKQSKEKSEE